MKLLRITSNSPALFKQVLFRDGLNVVLGEIRRPENRNRDTHNLGKSLLAGLIDFCLLKDVDDSFFLRKHPERFSEFVFYLDVEVDDGAVVTIRRPAAPKSKPSLRRSIDLEPYPDDLEEGDWDHWSVPLQAARRLLDAYLALSAVAPWTYRNVIGYALRTQWEYDDPFKLAKFAGKHIDWKPLLAKILGLDGELVRKNYELVASVTELATTIKRKKVELDGLEDLDQLKGLVRLKEGEIVAVQRELDSYDFRIADSRINKALVEELDLQIAAANAERYYTDTRIRRAELALAEQFSFDIRKIQRVFAQSEVYFPEQLKKDYDELVAFNRAIAKERNAYLSKELKELTSLRQQLETMLVDLNRKRAAALEELTDKQVVSRQRKANQHLAEKMGQLESLRKQEAALDSLRVDRERLTSLNRDLEDTRRAIANNIDSEPPRYAAIQRSFSQIVYAVIQKSALLFTKANQEGNPEFRAEVVDATGKATSAGSGFSYGRLLCVAFDMAVLGAYARDRYLHFVYHDGVLETLDDRKKLNLIDVMREHCHEHGVQQIVTAIDSELPQLPNGERFSFDPDEVVLRLHDEGDDGRLFMMAPW